MRFHVLGICHTVTSKDYLSCAFTQKVVKFCEMMMPSTPEDIEQKSKMTPEELVRHKTIHQLIHYGHERSDVICDEHVSVMTDDILIQTYGEYNWKKEFFKHGAGDLTHTTFVANTISELNKRKMSGDFILCFWGLGHKQIGDVFNSTCIVVEPGIGYPVESSFANFKVYESYACMHYHYGWRKKLQADNYDCVIPNYFDPKDFDFRIKKDNYFLYLGRIITSKGLQIILHMAKKMGFRLIVAGQGSFEHDIGVKTLPPNVEYVGFADMEKRRKLMAGARALFLPTQYIEPFGGVTMEAMMSGTPVITTDWGVFTETVLHGITGYRPRTLDQFEWSIRNIDRINPQACRDWALNNYGVGKVRGMYEEYFDMLLDVKFNKGFYQEKPERQELDWLYQSYPQQQADIWVQPTPKPKLAIYTEMKWAFGRIAGGLQKYLVDWEINLVDWSLGLPVDDRLFQESDLVYVMSWDIAKQLQMRFPQWAHKITFSGHGLVDFIKMKLNDTKNCQITREQIDTFAIDSELLTWLEDQQLGLSVVSHQLFDLLQTKGEFNPHYNPHYNLFLTQCGADHEIFTPTETVPKPTKFKAQLQAQELEQINLVEIGLEVPHPALKVIITHPKNTEDYIGAHGYDAKRLGLIAELETELNGRNIEFIWTDAVISNENMPEFYRQGDVFLCLSHSEGNPLGAFEASGCGLTVITTDVGEMSKFIQDGQTGFLIANTTHDEIKSSVITKLCQLESDRELLKTLKTQSREHFKNHWTWSNKIGQWDQFFKTCLETSQKLNELKLTFGKN